MSLAPPPKKGLLVLTISTHGMTGNQPVKYFHPPFLSLTCDNGTSERRSRHTNRK